MPVDVIGMLPSVQGSAKLSGVRVGARLASSLRLKENCKCLHWLPTFCTAFLMWGTSLQEPLVCCAHTSECASLQFGSGFSVWSNGKVPARAPEMVMSNTAPNAKFAGGQLARGTRTASRACQAQLNRKTSYQPLS